MYQLWLISFLNLDCDVIHYVKQLFIIHSRIIVEPIDYQTQLLVHDDQISYPIPFQKPVYVYRYDHDYYNTGIHVVDGRIENIDMTYFVNNTLLDTTFEVDIGKLDFHLLSHHGLNRLEFNEDQDIIFIACDTITIDGLYELNGNYKLISYI